MTTIPARSDRMTLVLAWVAILLCLGGVARFAWWNFTAPWGEGGEFAGASLGIETALWALVWAGTSVLGLILALVARWHTPRLGIVRLALVMNALSLLILLLGILVSFIRAREWERKYNAGRAHTCGLTDTLYCWRGNTTGQIGVALESGRPLLARVPGRR